MRLDYVDDTIDTIAYLESYQKNNLEGEELN